MARIPKPSGNPRKKFNTNGRTKTPAEKKRDKHRKK